MASKTLYGCAALGKFGGNMKKSHSSGLFLLISSMLAASMFMVPLSGQATYSFSGYVLDSNGHGVAGAYVNFNGVIPTAQTNSQGYYVTSAPAGSYQMYVWPPFDSNYINYDESGVQVSSNLVKNVTLQTGYKISGYVINASGSPMVGASVLFKTAGRVYGSGWFTNSLGYYYINVPEGTYTIDAHPQTAYNPSYNGPCTPFTTYYEYSFAVNSNLNKNITVSTAQPTPAPTAPPTSAPTTNPTQNPTPTPTPKPILPSTTLSISTEASSYQVGSTLTVKGNLTSQSETPFSGETVVLSSSLDGGETWLPVGSGKTDASGQYSIQWLIQASGTFSLKAEWAGNNAYSGSNAITAVSFLPYSDQAVFFVESNSTITELKFDSQNRILSFNVTGESGTKGQTQVTVAKTLVADGADFAVALDGKEMVYSVTSSSDYWILEFTYSHSTHQVTVNTVSQARIVTGVDDGSFILGVVLAAVVAALIAGALVFKRRTRKA
ncbi:MAG: carboxypeptidase-like regulatory domain-containing protein [Candidatus Bathyarchaeota archaeon]|nr:carboxypeptidase-like regulatory domain-containing protein [Candidatus Bathyarchaeota archaeon]